jgi:hypothetical protein
MAGWGDDPVMAQLQQAIADGWTPVQIRDERDASGTAFDVVVAEKDGERREFRSDHLAFHRFVEGLMDDYGLSYA